MTIEVLRDFGFLVEVKTTAMDSSSSRGISISRDVIEKIERQALELFMIPAVIKKCKFNGINYITMRMDDFMDILNTIRYTKSHGV
ncbi:hypothetical protein DRJ17_05100 [Candidatus Woesearchaeota archaeon]|nr:MAG: hypothetical protein DRJ17_05100 [Candidatus Woesearchaeota archaeon]